MRWRYTSRPKKKKKLLDIIDHALKGIEPIDETEYIGNVGNDWYGFTVWYDCDFNEYETPTIGMNIINTIKTHLREHPEFNVTEIDSLNLRLYFNRASEEKVENVMNDLLRMKRERERMKRQRTKRRRLSLRF